MQISELSKPAQRCFHLIEFDENEELIYELRKDPIGLFFIYLTGLAVTAILFGILVIGPSLLDGSSLGITSDLGPIKILIAVIGGLLTILSVVATAISAYLYKASVVLLTSEKIVQILYVSLFNRKISQLSIGDVQDVTVKQTGILAHLFKYGTIIIETAGEQQNYTFTFAPDPYEASKQIVGSHERNLQQYGN